MIPMPTSADPEFFRKLKVLVVDDSAEMRRLLAALLESMGVEQVVEARDGLKGLDAFIETSRTSSSPTARCSRWTATR